MTSGGIVIGVADWHMARPNVIYGTVKSKSFRLALLSSEQILSDIKFAADLLSFLTTFDLTLSNERQAFNKKAVNRAAQAEAV